MSGIGTSLEILLNKFGGREREVLRLWATEIVAMSAKIDPDGELDWHALFIGFALGKGLGMGQALNYDLYYNGALKCECMDLEEILGPLTPDYRAYLESGLDPRD